MSRDTKEPSTTILKFRYPPSRAAVLQLIADAETDGNISALVRDLVDRKIDERLRRRTSSAMEPAA